MFDNKDSQLPDSVFTPEAVVVIYAIYGTLFWGSLANPAAHSRRCMTVYAKSSLNMRRYCSLYRRPTAWIDGFRFGLQTIGYWTSSARTLRQVIAASTGLLKPGSGYGYVFGSPRLKRRRLFCG
jgi:hypothetical protein